MTTPETPPTETSPLVRSIRQLLHRRTGSSTSKLPDHDPSTTETLELLVPARRQAILEELATTDQTPVSASTLAERVACDEYGCSSESLGSDQRKRVYIALVQSHLPTLEKANVVTYDSDTKLVDCGPEFEQLWKTYCAVLRSLS